MEKYVIILMAALCCAAISHTICVTSIFKPIREYLSKIHPKIDQLIHCPWCLGHYVILIFLLTSDISLVIVSKYYIYNLFTTWFAIVCIMGIIHYVLLRTYEPIAKAAAQRKIDRLKKN